MELKEEVTRKTVDDYMKDFKKEPEEKPTLTKLERLRQIAKERSEKNREWTKGAICPDKNKNTSILSHEFKEQIGKGRKKIDIDMRLVFDLKKRGFSYSSIAKLYGVSEKTIYRRFKK